LEQEDSDRWTQPNALSENERRPAEQDNMVGLRLPPATPELASVEQ
jgi:hypothetical protein